jgi:small subunit ribosomal protein S3
MGQKVNPKAFRLGVVADWDSVWFDDKTYYKKTLQDYKIRKFLNIELFKAGISKIVIKRKSDFLDIYVSAARPGIIFGAGTIDLEVVSAQLKKIIQDTKLVIHIQEIKNPDSTAPLLAAWICAQIEKRVPFRRAMKMALQKCLKSGSQGVKVACAGRLAGIEIARTEWYKEGKIPLHTIRANIDYSAQNAQTTYGIIGVKVWIYKGEVNKQSLHDQDTKKNTKVK